MKTMWMIAFGALTACSTQTSGPTRPDDVELPVQEQIAVPAGTTTPAEPPAAGATTPPGSAPQQQPQTQAIQYKLPAWSLEDVQPKSARFQQRYGLEAYAGKTIVVVLLEGHCPYCQSNSVVAQKLQEELTAEKLDVQIVVLGDLNASQFAPKVSLPIFRDDDGNAWETMRPDASKHDTFVFGPDGKRSYFWLGSYQGDATRWRAEVGAAAREVARPAGSPD